MKIMKKIIEHTLKKNEKGFTLLEVLIAIFFLAVGLLGLARMMISTIKSNSLSNDITASVVLAQNKIEEFRNQGFTTTVLGGNGSDVVGNVTRNWTVTTPVSGVAQISVSCDWTDKAGFSRSITLNTLLK